MFSGTTPRRRESRPGRTRHEPARPPPRCWYGTSARPERAAGPAPRPALPPQSRATHGSANWPGPEPAAIRALPPARRTGFPASAIAAPLYQDRSTIAYSAPKSDGAVGLYERRATGETAG